jgi:hypothetical protein
MGSETFYGGPGHEPFTPFLTSFQSPLFDEHQDAQMGGTEFFRSFKDRYRFCFADCIFHGDISLVRQGKQFIPWQERCKNKPLP